MIRISKAYLERVILFALILTTASLHVQAWNKTYLGESFALYGENGFPITDEYGDPVPSIPETYVPSVRSFSGALHVLTLEASDVTDPPELDSRGFPVIGQYHQFRVLSETGSGWTESDAVSELLEGMDSPHFADRLDPEPFEQPIEIAYSKGVRAGGD